MKAETLRRTAVIAAANDSPNLFPMKTISPDTRFVPQRARISEVRRISYFDDDSDARYEAVDTHATAEGIVVSLAIAILLWAFIGLGLGWL